VSERLESDRTQVEPVVATYLDHLRVERGLAPNSLAAYERDLRRLADFARRRRRPVSELCQAHLAEFIASLKGEGLSARSVARTVHGV
jgi:site-specific recombinase XerD